MTLIYLVVSVILAAMTWVCSQLDWQYGYILMYICMFFTSWYVALVFMYQEEYDRSKKFLVFTVPHILFYVIDILLLVLFWKYNLKEWRTVTYAKYKAIVLMNILQGSFLMLYFKLKDFYTHL